MSKNKLEIKENVVRRLELTMIENNINQTELVKKGVGSSTLLSNILNRKAGLSEYVASKLAEELNVRTEYLLCIDDYKTEQDKKWGEIKKENDLIDSFEYLLSDMGISIEFCGTHETDYIIGSYEEYDRENDTTYCTDKYEEEGLNKITLKNGEEYILTDQQLSEIRNDIFSYVEMRIKRNCKYFNEENVLTYWEDIIASKRPGNVIKH
ncbi:MAG: hypothetical protein ACI4CC_08670 [Lachnospiraceae bacterium]